MDVTAPASPLKSLDLEGANRPKRYHIFLGRNPSTAFGSVENFISGKKALKQRTADNAGICAQPD